MWDFAYCSNAFFLKIPLCTSPTYLEIIRGGELSQVKNVETDKDVVMVSELYDKKRKQYMYCAVNTTDIQRYIKKYKKEKQLTVMQFNEQYNVADVYQNGKWQTVALDDGKLSVRLYAGEGVIILPYKEVEQ